MKLKRYSEAENPSHSDVYFFDIKNDKQKLYYFGANHSFEPKNEQYDLLKKEWNKFLQDENKKKIVMVEGAVRNTQEMSEEESIKQDSEAGLLSLLAQKNDIEIMSPELSYEKEWGFLEEEFGTKRSAYYFFSRVAAQWFNKTEKPTFEEYMRKDCESDKELISSGDYVHTYENIKEIHRELFHTGFDELDEEHFSNQARPTKNEVSRYCNDLRDINIIKEIQKYWDEGYSIFIAYGSSHTYVQEDYLKNNL